MLHAVGAATAGVTLDVDWTSFLGRADMEFKWVAFTCSSSWQSSCAHYLVCAMLRLPVQGPDSPVPPTKWYHSAFMVCLPGTTP